MLILHLSDIHFRAPNCLNPDTDRDRPYRTRLERDLVKRVRVLGAIDAIIVGGDIAFGGDPAEFAEGRRWLLALADMCGCSKDAIMVVPGNHDVDRTACEAISTRNVHAVIASAKADDREWMLERQLGDTSTGQALFHGHSAYNEFAKHMQCQVYPGRLYWKQDIDLGRGVSLRIHGLTSTLLSGRDGVDDKRGHLFLSALQTTLDPVPDVANMVVCHHPPDWLLDGDEVDDMLNVRATFHVFGHKHKQRILQEKSFVRWSAAAVNPSRHERQFEPGYNIVRLEVAGEGAGRRIDVESHLFRYVLQPEGFQPIQTDSGQDVHQHSIAFPSDTLRVVPAAMTPLGATIAAGEVSGPGPVTASVAQAGSEDAEASMGDSRTRHIVDRFWELDGSDRREIVRTLDLISADEIKLPEPQRYGIALIRAAERRLICKLEEMVAERELPMGES